MGFINATHYSRKFISGGIREKEDDETQKERRRVQRVLYLVWRSLRSFRLPTFFVGLTPPLRSTSIPLNVPLTEASAQF
jgi:hypothetical protein